jgi:hypothetical protein
MGDNSLIKLGLTSVLSAAGVPGAGPLLGIFSSLADPNKRKALQQAIEDHVLEELPRMASMINNRIDEVVASGCSVQEASIVAYQVIESQKRTLDEEKRRNLSLVLVNGLCAQPYDKVKHRLMVRLTTELEVDHVERLRSASRSETLAGRTQMRSRQSIGATDAERDERSLRNALDRELISRGLMEEKIKPIVKMHKREAMSQPATVENVELQTSIKITRLGLALLDYLAEPAT